MIENNYSVYPKYFVGAMSKNEMKQFIKYLSEDVDRANDYLSCIKERG